MEEKEMVKAVIDILREKDPIRTRLMCRLFYNGRDPDTSESRIRVPTEEISKLIKAFESAGFVCGPEGSEEVDQVTILLQDLLIEQKEEEEFEAGKKDQK